MSRTKHHTAWAGALAVASELSRRAYDAALTFGNTPSIDLLCASPNGKPFVIQVKSLTEPNAVLIKEAQLAAKPNKDLFFAVVIVPKSHKKPMEFRILTHKEIVALWGKMPDFKKSGEPYKQGIDGVYWRLIQPFKDGWEKLPK